LPAGEAHVAGHHKLITDATGAAANLGDAHDWRGREAQHKVALFNIANLSLLSPTVPGPESLLANRPTTIVLFILAQIVVTLFLVGIYASRPLPPYLTGK
jgi:hypothetical protein